MPEAGAKNVKRLELKLRPFNLEATLSVLLRSPEPEGSLKTSGKEKAHKHKRLFPVTARVGGLNQLVFTMPLVCTLLKKSVDLPAWGC